MGSGTVRVDNLPETGTEEDLFSLFSSLKPRMDGVSWAKERDRFGKRAAFAKFLDPAGATEACSLDGRSFRGSLPIRVSKCVPPSETCNIQNLTDSPPRAEMVDCSLKNSMAHLNNHDENRAKNTIQVEGFDSELTESLLSEYFSQFGPVSRVMIYEGFRRFARIEFVNHETAVAALNSDGQETKTQHFKIIPSPSAIDKCQTKDKGNTNANDNVCVTDSPSVIADFAPLTAENKLKQYFSKTYSDAKQTDFSNQVGCAAIVSNFENEPPSKLVPDLKNSNMSGYSLKISPCSLPSHLIYKDCICSNSKDSATTMAPENSIDCGFTSDSPSESSTIPSLISLPSSINDFPTVTEESVVIHSRSNNEIADVSSRPQSGPTSSSVLSFQHPSHSHLLDDNDAVYLSSGHVSSSSSPSSFGLMNSGEIYDDNVNGYQWGSHCSFSTYYVTDVQGNKRVTEFEYSKNKKRRKL